jgi:hypothetical protein
VHEKFAEVETRFKDYVGEFQEELTGHLGHYFKDGSSAEFVGGINVFSRALGAGPSGPKFPPPDPHPLPLFSVVPGRKRIGKMRASAS